MKLIPIINHMIIKSLIRIYINDDTSKIKIIDFIVNNMLNYQQSARKADKCLLENRERMLERL